MCPTCDMYTCSTFNLSGRESFVVHIQSKVVSAICQFSIWEVHNKSQYIQLKVIQAVYGLPIGVIGPWKDLWKFLKSDISVQPCLKHVYRPPVWQQGVIVMVNYSKMNCPVYLHLWFQVHASQWYVLLMLIHRNFIVRIRKCCGMRAYGESDPLGDPCEAVPCTERT